LAVDEPNVCDDDIDNGNMKAWLNSVNVEHKSKIKCAVVDKSRNNKIILQHTETEMEMTE